MKTVRRRKSSKVSDGTEDWTVIYCETLEEVEECIGNPEIIWPILRRTIERILNENREALPSIEVRCAEMFGSVWVTVNRKDIPATLTKMLNWRLEREEYEECAEIKKLQERSEWPSSVKKSADTDEN